MSEAGQVAQCGDLSTFTGIHLLFLVVSAQKMRSPQALQCVPCEFGGIWYIGKFDKCTEKKHNHAIAEPSVAIAYAIA